MNKASILKRTLQNRADMERVSGFSTAKISAISGSI